MLLRRLAAGKSRAGWAERWGRLPAELRAKEQPRIWVHAASVGEVMAAQPLLAELRARLPEHQIVLSTITPGGHETASNLVGGLLHSVVYAPFDMPWVVCRATATIRPDLFIVLETELWPNLLHAVGESGAKLALVNGRISDRSVGRYRRLRPLFAWALSNFDRVLVQTERDAERFREIGAAPDRVRVLGNTKFDQAPARLSAEEAAALRQELRLPAEAPLWIAASTRTPEEERMVYAAHHIAAKALPGLCLIHAPRHIDRAADVASLMREAGMQPVRRTELAAGDGSVRHLILDTFGELARVYAVADVAFLGNSLVSPGGGQNLLQPLAQGKAALYGPYTQNFRDAVALAESAGVGFRVDGAESLARELIALLKDAGRREEIARRAVDLVDSNRGAAARYADAITELLRSPSA